MALCRQAKQSAALVAETKTQGWEGFSEAKTSTWPQSDSGKLSSKEVKAVF